MQKIQLIILSMQAFGNFQQKNHNLVHFSKVNIIEYWKVLKKKKEYINRVLAEGYFKLSITITIIQFFKDLICYNKFNLYIKPLS